MSDFRQSDAYQITWLTRRLFRAMADKADSYLQPLGITAADRAILEFLYPDKVLTVPQLAKRYNVSRQHVQVTVNPLLESGLIKQQPNPAHKRSSHIVLTTAGRKLFDKVRKADQRAIEALFADVSTTGQRQTRATLTTLLERLTTEGESS
jgi:DNA-binding MarR family transcriptional regulator